MKQHKGFSLVELMISVALGLIITTAMIQVYQSNNNLQAYNYALSNIQQDGRYIISALRQSLLPVGNYNEFSISLDNSVDTTIESLYIKQHPIVLQGDYLVQSDFGTLNGENAGSDTLVVNLMASENCNGSNMNYPLGSEFHVVNEYFIDDTTLRCRGHDGRYLRGLRANGASGQSVALLENVHDLQVLYGISQPIAGLDTGFVTSWITADRLTDFIGVEGNLPVVAIKLAVLIKNDHDIAVDNIKKLKMLDLPAFTSEGDGIYRVFDTVILFRSAWYNVTTGV